MLITYASAVHMTQAGFLSTNTVNLAHLYCYILNRENKNNLTFETFKNEITKQIKFP